MNFIPERTDGTRSENTWFKIATVKHMISKWGKLRGRFIQLLLSGWIFNWISQSLLFFGHHWPVRVWKQWSLKTSVSSISIPELPTSGDSCEPIANNLVEKHKERQFNAWDRDPQILTGCQNQLWMVDHYLTRSSLKQGTMHMWSGLVKRCRSM